MAWACVEPLEVLFFGDRNTFYQGLLHLVVALLQTRLGMVRGPRIRLAMTRGDLERIERLVEGRSSSGAFYLGSQTALLDGLAAIGARDRVEAAVEPLLKPATYLEAFALRALGVVREEEELIRQALSRFEALGLEWYAAQTRELILEA